MLSALVEHRHDDRNPSCLALDRRDDALEVCEMLVGTHRDGHAVHFISHTVVKGITDDENVLAAHGLVEHCLALARAEPQTLRADNESPVSAVSAPVTQIVVHLRGELLTALHSDHTKLSATIVLHKCLQNMFSLGFAVQRFLYALVFRIRKSRTRLGRFVFAESERPESFRIYR